MIAAGFAIIIVVVPRPPSPHPEPTARTAARHTLPVQGVTWSHLVNIEAYQVRVKPELAHPSEHQQHQEEQHKDGATVINWTRWRRSRTWEAIPNGIVPVNKKIGTPAGLLVANQPSTAGLQRHGCGELGGRQGKASLPDTERSGGAFPYDDGCGAAYRSIGMP